MPAEWVAPRTSISTDGNGGLWASLCDRHYRVLPRVNRRVIERLRDLGLVEIVYQRPRTEGVLVLTDAGREALGASA